MALQQYLQLGEVSKPHFEFSSGLLLHLALYSARCKGTHSTSSSSSLVCQMQGHSQYFLFSSDDDFAAAVSARRCIEATLRLLFQSAVAASSTIADVDGCRRTPARTFSRGIQRNSGEGFFGRNEEKKSLEVTSQKQIEGRQDFLRCGGHIVFEFIFGFLRSRICMTPSDGFSSLID